MSLCAAYVRFIPESDIDCVFRHVGFGPIADIVGQGCTPPALSAQWVGSMVDRATVFDPILEGTEVIDFPIAHILKNLSA